VIYTVHSRGEPLDSLRSLDETRFVKEGFSWPAFVFTAAWLLYKRMWIVLISAVAIQILLGVEADRIGAPWWFAPIAGFALSLLLGFEGNALYRWSLARRGYGEVGLASGADIEDAEARYFDE
jgi:predicted membrane chloride channel (bestrophin family)